jgi:DNA polymerase elongation subunit (family B)
MITSIIRDLLHYVKDNLELKGYKIVYIDTDSVFATDGGEDLTGLLNRLIDEWSYSKFNKPSEITFEAEGRFDSIVILSKCRYYGMLRGKGGVRKEIKGIEAKKINSSQFESRFQEELLKRILDNQPKTTVTDWVIDQQRQIKTQPLLSVAYPCKIKNQTYEKTTPIFVRAYNNTKSLFKDFRIGNGELFYYVYTNPLNDDEQGKPRDVFATSAEFDVIEKSHGTIKINWEEMTRRSIVSKAEEIFEAMKWGNINHILNGQVSLF